MISTFTYNNKLSSKISRPKREINMLVCLIIFSCFLMMDMANGSCSEYQNVWWCVGNSTLGVPTNATGIRMHIDENSGYFENMARLTNLRFISLNDMGVRVLKSSEFAIFPKLNKLVIDNMQYKSIMLEEIELTGIIISSSFDSS